MGRGFTKGIVMEEPSEFCVTYGLRVSLCHSLSSNKFCHRFEEGPRIRGAKYMDISDISATKENFPELNPKGLPHMLPPEVRLPYMLIHVSE